MVTLLEPQTLERAEAARPPAPEFRRETAWYYRMPCAGVRYYGFPPQTAAAEVRPLAAQLLADRRHAIG